MQWSFLFNHQIIQQRWSNNSKGWKCSCYVRFEQRKKNNWSNLKVVCIFHWPVRPISVRIFYEILLIYICLILPLTFFDEIELRHNLRWIHRHWNFSALEVDIIPLRVFQSSIFGSEDQVNVWFIWHYVNEKRLTGVKLVFLVFCPVLDDYL